MLQWLTVFAFAYCVATVFFSEKANCNTTKNDREDLVPLLVYEWSGAERELDRTVTLNASERDGTVWYRSPSSWLLPRVSPAAFHFILLQTRKKEREVTAEGGK